MTRVSKVRMLKASLSLLKLPYTKSNMDKETLVRIAQPAATLALAISVATLPMTVKAYGEMVEIYGTIRVNHINSCS